MNRYLNLTYKFTFILTILLAAVNLIGSNLLSTHGQTLETTNQELVSIRKENLYLTAQIAQNSSLSTISLKAQGLGFVTIDKPLALSTPAPVAYVAQ